MKVLAWINLVMASLMALYSMAAIPYASDVDEMFLALFVVVVFALFAVYPAINLFAKKLKR